MIVGRIHDLLPQRARLNCAVHPFAIAALLAFRFGRRLLMHELPITVDLDRAHEGVGYRHAYVEILEIAAVLGMNEILDVGMIAAQNAHLRAAPRAGGFDRLAALIEYAHIRHGPARAALRAAH